MVQNLSEPLKAILLRIAIELKKLGWKPNVVSNEIDIFQGHIDMSKEFNYDGNGDTPNVASDVSIDLTLEQNEQNQVWFLTYTVNYSMWVDGVGGSDKTHQSDVSVPFTETDANNLQKVMQAASEVNSQIDQMIQQEAHEYSGESSQEHDRYRSEKGWQEPED